MFFASIDIVRIVREAGLLIYPLGLCSLVATFIIVERLVALRKSAVIPEDLAEAVIEGRAPSGDKRSALGRILNFASRKAPFCNDWLSSGDGLYQLLSTRFIVELLL